MWSCTHAVQFNSIRQQSQNVQNWSNQLGRIGQCSVIEALPRQCNYVGISQLRPMWRLDVSCTSWPIAIAVTLNCVRHSCLIHAVVAARTPQQGIRISIVLTENTCLDRNRGVGEFRHCLRCCQQAMFNPGTLSSSDILGNFPQHGTQAAGANSEFRRYKGQPCSLPGYRHMIPFVKFMLKRLPKPSPDSESDAWRQCWSN